MLIRFLSTVKLIATTQHKHCELKIGQGLGWTLFVYINVQLHLISWSIGANLTR
jgi:hypothetical protein